MEHLKSYYVPWDLSGESAHTHTHTHTPVCVQKHFTWFGNLNFHHELLILLFSWGLSSVLYSQWYGGHRLRYQTRDGSYLYAGQLWLNVVLQTHTRWCCCWTQIGTVGSSCAVCSGFVLFSACLYITFLSLTDIASTILSFQTHESAWHGQSAVEWCKCGQYPDLILWILSRVHMFKGPIQHFHITGCNKQSDKQSLWSTCRDLFILIHCAVVLSVKHFVDLIKHLPE